MDTRCQPWDQKKRNVRFGIPNKVFECEFNVPTDTSAGYGEHTIEDPLGTALVTPSLPGRVETGHLFPGNMAISAGGYSVVD